MNFNRGKRFNRAKDINWQAYSHVSFDIFDTALLRRTRIPTDIFDLMTYHKLEKDNFGSWCFPDNFGKLRQEAEKLARIKVWTQYNSYEVTLEEIYQELSRLLQLNDKVQDSLMRLELQVELENLFANEYIKGIFDSVSKRGIKILFISDIYHDREFISSVLSSSGYLAYDALYLSSETKLTKSSGTLFELIMESQKIMPRKWLHVGDNVESDILQTNRLGIDSLYYEKCLLRTIKAKNLSARLDSSLSHSNPSVASLIYGATATKFFKDPSSSKPKPELADCGSIWYQWGYTHAGPLLLGFLQWLFASVTKNKAEAIYFLARDGFFVKHAFDQLYPDIVHNVSSHYMYASRRLFNFAAITDLDPESVAFLTSGTSCLTVAGFLERISIKPSDCSDQIRSSGFEDDMVYVRSGRDYECLRKLMQSIEPLILDQAARERAVLQKYLHQVAFHSHNRVMIVDLGWHGSLQVSLEKLKRIYGFNTEILGRYLGTFPRAAEYTKAGHNIQGFLCDVGIPEKNFRDIRKCVEIYEWLFSAPHGTICGLRHDGTEIVSKNANNPIDVVRWNTASEAQAGALEFLQDISRSFANSNLSLSAAEANCLMTSFLTLPTFEEACLFGDIPHEEGFGSSGHFRYVAKPDNRLHMKINPYAFYKESKTCFWKKGYFKRRRTLSKIARFFG